MLKKKEVFRNVNTNYFQTLDKKTDTGLDIISNMLPCSWPHWLWLHEMAMMLSLPSSGSDSSDTLCLDVKVLLVFTGPCDFHCIPSSNPQSMPPEQKHENSPR